MSDGTATLQYPLFFTTSGDWSNTDWPLFTASAEGYAGADGTATLNIPLFNLTAVNGESLGSGDYPLFGLSASGATGVIGAGAADYAMFTVVGEGIGGDDGVGASSYTLFSMLGAGSAGTIATLDRRYPLFSLTASGGPLNAASLAYPLFTVSASGSAVITATTSLNWPLFIATAAGQAEPITITDPTTEDEYVVWVVNTETKAHSTYRNFLVNSLQDFNGSRYVATPDGIYELTGDDDAGTNIDAKVYWPPTDFGTSKLKRLDSAYLNLRHAGDYRFVMITDEKQKRIYHENVGGGQDEGTHRYRAVMTRGLRGQMWQAGYENIGGDDFALTDIEVVTLKESRKIK